MSEFDERNHRFTLALTDVQMAYIDAERKVTELEKENEKLRGKLQAMRAHGIEVVDAVAGGVEIYSEEHAELDRLKAENEELRDELKQWERLTKGIKPKDFERENKELRKTCLDLYSHLLEFGCMPNTHKADFCPELRELGILTYSNCDKCDAHGYPPKGMEKTAFTISLWCSETDESKSPYESCDKHQIGEPRIMRDDVDVF